MSDCIEWTGRVNAGGYGSAWVKGHGDQLAHRVAYCDHSGLSLRDIKGKAVLHKCDNPPCINPAHLRLGTWRDNNKDRSAKGRTARQVGHANGRCVLTEADVKFIRSVYTPGRGNPNNTANLAKRFNVSRNQIWLIIKNESWSHVS